MKTRSGRNKRRIRRAFLADPGALLTTGDPVRYCYPRFDSSSAKQGIACVRRAAERAAKYDGLAENEQA
jgi:hypothetical protein